MKNQRPPTRKEIQDQARVLLKDFTREQKYMKDKSIALLLSGLKQLTQGKGFKAKQPIKGIGEYGFLGLLDLLNLNIKSEESIKQGRLRIDKIKVKPGQRKYRFNLYNLVDPRQKEEKFAVLG